MKNFKLVDFGVQILIILICIIAIVMDQIDFYRAYFIAGGSQLLSMLLHECLRYFTTKGTQRRVYHNICYILCGCMLLTPLVYVTGVVFIPLLFAAPLMALYYLHLCYKETFVYLKRPLSILK
ncbi:MAG TPA: hypothetical protein PKM63_09985 [Panacibacter sp.]|nr:hypothetical protein [Panacibacter sp.]HNP44604.1 hypothetical protein [Panacibacter sp.]